MSTIIYCNCCKTVLDKYSKEWQVISRPDEMGKGLISVKITWPPQFDICKACIASSFNSIDWIRFMKPEAVEKLRQVARNSIDKVKLFDEQRNKPGY